MATFVALALKKNRPHGKRHLRECVERTVDGLCDSLPNISKIFKTLDTQGSIADANLSLSLKHRCETNWSCSQRLQLKLYHDLSAIKSLLINDYDLMFVYMSPSAISFSDWPNVDPSRCDPSDEPSYPATIQLLDPNQMFVVSAVLSQ